MKCLGGTKAPCSGPVEMRCADGLKAWPRCDLHYDKYLDSIRESQIAMRNAVDEAYRAVTDGPWHA